MQLQPCGRRVPPRPQFSARSFLKAVELRSYYPTSAAAVAQLAAAGMLLLQVVLGLSLALRHRLPRWARAPTVNAGAARLLLVEWLFSVCLTPVLVASSADITATSCAATAAPCWGDAGLAYLRTLHLARSLHTVLLQARARRPHMSHTCKCGFSRPSAR